MVRLLYIFCAAILLSSCEKEITVDLPPYTPKIVVEGSIEPGSPPLILLSRSQGFFDPSDLASYQSSFIKNATVSMTTSQGTIVLTEICSASLPPELLPLVEEYTGISAVQLAALNICMYTTLDTLYWGQTGQSYALSITDPANNETVTSTTSIPQPIPLDSVFFEIETESYGFAWAVLSDPPGLGNAYRWFAKRTNTSTNGLPKDASFQAPWGSAFNDEFIEGLTFEFAYSRAGSANDDASDRDGYYRIGDTVAIKFTTIPFDGYEYFRALEQQLSSNGSPFASPANIPSNIEGGLGLWIGYGVSYDTLICIP